MFPAFPGTVLLKGKKEGSEGVKHGGRKSGVRKEMKKGIIQQCNAESGVCSARRMDPKASSRLQKPSNCITGG
jgi:hypothetical protein